MDLINVYQIAKSRRKRELNSKNSLVTKLAFLSVSFVITSAYAVQGSLPQLKAALHISQTQSEYIATTPSYAVMVFVVLSPLLQQWFKISDKKMIMAGVTVVGIAGLIPMFVSNYPVILLSRLLLGAGFGLYNSQCISMISVWYDGDVQSQMLGWRAAAEQIGQAFCLWVAGLFLTFSGNWHMPFLVYALAFIVLVFFAWRVPDDSAVQREAAEEAKEAETAVKDNGVTKISPLVYVLVLFAFVLCIDYVGLENRYSGLAVAIKGAQYTGASNFLSLMLIGATLGGLFYGTIHKYLGFGTVYLGLGLMALANFMIDLAGHNFWILTAGLLMVGFPLQLVSPMIFDLLPGLAPAKNQPMVTSLVLIGFNFGAAFSPTVAEWTNKLLGKPLSGFDLAAPFPYYGALLVIIAIIIFVSRRSSTKR